MRETSFVPKGAAEFHIDHDGPAKEYYFLLLPQLTMLALSSAIEPLRVANQVSQKELYRWFTLSNGGVPVQCSNNIAITPDDDLINVPRQARVFVCGGTEPMQMLNSRTTSWVSRQARFGVPVGAICTGAFSLAKAGLLAGRKFTVHWENQPAFAESFPDLVPSANLFEIDGDLMTAAGGSASADMMLGIIETDFGRDFAVVVSDMCLHGRSNATATLQKSAYSAALGTRNPKLIKAMQLMRENAEDPLTLDEIAAELDISRRQLERTFKTHLGATPKQYYNNLRVERAYALLSETEMTVLDVAIATGFTSSVALSRRFRARYGMVPGAFRKQWNTPLKSEE